MVQAQLIGRPEKVKHLRELLSDHQIVYLSSFFYSGKTVLLDQLADSLTGPVLRFCAEKDDWSAFTAKASRNPNAVLLIDDLQQFPNLDTEEALTTFLENLPRTQRAVLAGRAKKPVCLRTLMMKGRAAVLDNDFVLFNSEEAEQLLLDYGLRLLPQDLDYLMNACWGSPIALQAAAQRMAKEPGKSVRTVWAQTYEEIKRLLIHDVVLGYPEQERIFLCNLSPFERFTEDMARIVTGRTDAPAMLERIEDNSWAFLKDGAHSYSFIPIMQEALFYEMKNLYTSDYIDGQYSRAALYYELSGQVPEAITCYLRLNDTPKIRELLIRDTQLRPANGDYVMLRKAYSVLPEEMILSSPELMKGICMIESLQGRPEESARWYQELKRFLKNTSPRDGRYRAAEEAIAYLDIGLAWRGTRNILQTLVATAKLKSLTQSASWRSGFNVAGNSVSLMNGGKDFCRWNPHGWNIYRLAKTPVEMALGRGGSGMGDIAIGECELESNLTGDYALAMEKVLSGLSRVGDDLEMRCAAVGIQSRILTAEGNLPEALGLIGNLLKTLSDDAPLRLRENLTVHRLTLLLMRGETQEALSWLETDAPDETRDFIILDRYKYLLKLRLYIITGKFDRTRLLTAQLKQYFEAYDRPYMHIQLHMLQAMIDRRSGRGDWRAELTAAVELAKRYRLARVIADEGMGILDMLTELELPTGPWEQGVLNLTRQQAARCPHYMKPSGTRPVFTDREYAVYSLLIAGYSNAKIGALLGISERTVSFSAYPSARSNTMPGRSTRSSALRLAPRPSRGHASWAIQTSDCTFAPCKICFDLNKLGKEPDMIEKMKQEWRMLSRSIYTGERLEANLRALVAVSIVTAALGLVLTVYDIAKGETIMTVAAVNTFLGGLGCWICAGPLKNREAAAVIPTAFCAIVFTIYTFFGLAEGTAMLWSILLPIGMCYFVSVKYGILLSVYYTVLYFVVFYTPLKARMSMYYTDAFMARFPLLFASLTIFTAIAMAQYHRVSLLEQSYQEELSREVEKQTKVANERADKLETMTREIVQTLAVTIDAKDKYTNGHSFRVSRYSMALARSLRWSEEEIQVLGVEGLLHDIGKIGVPDLVLNKPGRLTDEEFSVIKSHTTIGDEILNQSGSLLEAAQVARHHHERYDGRGYPDRLKGSEIPLHARAVAIADAYDAMRSDRIYRKGLPPETIRGEMIRGRGTQFDPELLDAFLLLMDTEILNEIAEQDIFKLRNLETA